MSITNLGKGDSKSLDRSQRFLGNLTIIDW